MEPLSGDQILKLEERARYYKELMRPYAEKAERDAQEILEALEVPIPKTWETVPEKGIYNKVFRWILKYQDI